MRHAVEEYVGQLDELKESVNTMTTDLQNSIDEIISLQARIRELESLLDDRT